MKKNKILWISSIAWLKKENVYFPEATYPGIVSGSAFQQAIIEGLEMQNCNIRILSDCDMSSGTRIEWSHNGVSKDIRVAGNGNKFLRIPKKIKELLLEIIKGDILQNIDIVFGYEMHLPYLICLYVIKKINPNIKTILICPDLSIYMDLNTKNKKVKSFLKKIESLIMKLFLKGIDGYILFTEQMQDYFSNYNKPYLVIEGVYRDKYSLKTIEKEYFIMHAGSLHNNVGIKELVEAFEILEDKNIMLYFFGKGELDDYIKEKSKGNNRIKHMGFIDPKELFEYEKKATILINVRDPKEKYTKYSFPSKTFEYLASGTIFLSTDLQGIPNEYKEYIITIKDNKIETIKDGLDYILSLSEEERNNYGKKAREFILKSKNKIIQSKKIIEFLSEL